MRATYYFAGHETLSNRGCEALLRGITTIVRSERPQAAFLAPSFDPHRDGAQWPNALGAGLRFVPAYRLAGAPKLWVRAQASLPFVRRAWFPKPEVPAAILAQIGEADACIMTGGDVLSLEYGMAGLIKYMGQAETFMRQGKPVMLWGGSVGPFTAMPDVERQVVRHLARYSAVTVRESATQAYLRSLGLREPVLVADPAFAMEPEAFDANSAMPVEREEGLLGLNISPLVKLILERKAPGSGRDMEASICEFLTDVVTRTALGIILIPHVDSIDGGPANSDYLYMQTLLKRANLPAARIALAPRDLNAAQLKYLVGRCRYFIGARTHATIAALSSGVPTCSLAYSVKARGLNRDLFGDERYVQDTQTLTKSSLWMHLDQLRSNDGDIRAVLLSRMPEWRTRAQVASSLLV